MLKKYIKPQTDTVKVQAQEILAGSDRTFNEIEVNNMFFEPQLL